jgi:hypothetical protein
MFLIKTVLINGVLFFCFVMGSLIIITGLSKETITVRIENKSSQHISSMTKVYIRSEAREHIIYTDKGKFITSKKIYDSLSVSQSYEVNIKGFDAFFARKEILSLSLNN